ncbi:MAG: cytochrome C [Gammaproteobacteria bacterium]|nr:MAG: cytochrome C [Gammaproteobacteria bacterium]
MKKLLLALLVSVAAPGFAAQPDMKKFNQSCKLCHANGVAGAPKTHDTDAWAPAMQKGMDVLIESVKKGMGAMPPKAMCYQCSDEDYRAMIEFMAAPAE